MKTGSDEPVLLIFYAQAIKLAQVDGRGEDAPVQLLLNQRTGFCSLLLCCKPVDTGYSGNDFLFDYQRGILPDVVAPAMFAPDCFNLETGKAFAALI